MNERMKGFLGMLGKNLGITEAVNPQARMQTGEALPTGQDQFNIARERADIPSPRADFADKSRIAKNEDRHAKVLEEMREEKTLKDSIAQ